MISKKDLRALIKTIKEKSGKTQQEISKGAGYAAKTLTQLLSKDEDLEPAYNQLKLVYKDLLNNSTLSGQSVDYFIGKLEAKQEVIAEKEARRLEAMALADRMEAHYKDAMAALERAQNTINEVLKPIKENTEAIKSNSDTILNNIEQVQRMTRADDLSMMEGTDKILGRESGTTAKEAGIVERAFGEGDEEIHTKDNASSLGKTSIPKKR